MTNDKLSRLSGIHAAVIPIQSRTASGQMKKIRKYIFPLFFAIVYFFPFSLSLRSILDGSIPFWYDNARDLLLALDNLKKPTLIGPPSGIPGVFYGPYWIWLMSSGLLFTRDPRFIAFLLQFLPYFALFPFLLFQFTRIFDKKTFLILWTLFIFAFSNYTTFLWNPHLAPLLFLFVIYLALFTDRTTHQLTTYVQMFLWGFTGGVLLFFHISFGLGVLVGSFFFIILECISVSKMKIVPLIKSLSLSVLPFLLGILLSFLPFFIFEFRHDFLQIRAIGKILTDAIFYNSAAVGQTGFSPGEIIYRFFFFVPSSLLSLSPLSFFGIGAFLLLFCLYRGVPKQPTLTREKKKLVRFLAICSISVLYLYLSSKNPVWDYHFIGVEVIVLLLLAIGIEQFSFLSKSVSLWTAAVVLLSLLPVVKSAPKDPYSISTLATKKHIVDVIYQDAKAEHFSVFVYSPSIYTYDFDYLFRWMGSEMYGYEPEKDLSPGAFVYLIIPKAPESVQVDFIHYKTPDTDYETVNQWNIPDGTLVLKRSKKI